MGPRVLKTRHRRYAGGVLSDSYKVQKIIQNYPGQTPIVLVDAKRQAKGAPRDWNVKVDEELMSTLQAVFGKENVILR